MPADAILWIAIGSLLLLGYAIVRAIVLAQVALRDGGEVEVEVRAPSLSFRVRAGRTRCTWIHVRGEGSSTAQDSAPAQSPERPKSR